MQGTEHSHIVGVIYSSTWSIKSWTGQTLLFWIDTLGLVFVLAWVCFPMWFAILHRLEQCRLQSQTHSNCLWGHVLCRHCLGHQAASPLLQQRPFRLLRLQWTWPPYPTHRHHERSLEVATQAISREGVCQTPHQYGLLAENDHRGRHCVTDAHVAPRDAVSALPEDTWHEWIGCGSMSTEFHEGVKWVKLPQLFQVRCNLKVRATFVPKLLETSDLGTVVKQKDEAARK